jgi:hypothetical protein
MRDGHMAKSTKGRHQQLDQFAGLLSHGAVDEHRFACRTSSVGSHHCTDQHFSNGGLKPSTSTNLPAPERTLSFPGNCDVTVGIFVF